MTRSNKHKKKGVEAEHIPRSPKMSEGEPQSQGAPPPGQQPTESPGQLYEGPRASKESRDKISRLQKETEDVTGVMRGNVDQMLSRGESMQDLSKQTESLQSSSKVFATKATAVKRKLWWKNFRTMIIVSFIVILIVIAIVGSFLWRR
jgi:hypothetical protein